MAITVERLVSKTKVVKTDLRNHLNERNLEGLLGIKIFKVSLSKFLKEYAEANLKSTA